MNRAGESRVVVRFQKKVYNITIQIGKLMPLEVQIALQGCWIDQNRYGIPALQGVYFVYACEYFHEKNSVTLKRLLYVGQSENVNQRLLEHEGLLDWRTHLLEGEMLCFAVAQVEGSVLSDVEAAMIYVLKPSCNAELKNQYTHRPIRVKSSPTSFLLPSEVIAP